MARKKAKRQGCHVRMSRQNATCLENFKSVNDRNCAARLKKVVKVTILLKTKRCSKIADVFACDCY